MTTEQIILAAILFLTGLCFGSFLNVLVYRLPQNLSITKPPSNCPACGKTLGVLELIPVIGYLIIKGHCRNCNVKVSLSYPLFEILTGLIFVFTLLVFGLGMDFFIHITLLYLLLAISRIDLEHKIVPNSLVAAGLILGFLYYGPQLLLYLFQVPDYLISTRSWLDALTGMLTGGAVMLIIFIASKGGMGAGDIKLMALIGLYLGLQGTATVLMLGFIFGALTGIVFMIAGKLTRKDALPFAPFLSLAAYIHIFWGEQIWNWYTSLW